MANFVHLHTHSDYSTLDGAQKIKTIVKMAKEMELPAVALTDHGNMFGAIELANEAQRAGIKPIFGCEMYIARGSHHDHISIKEEEGKYFHLVLLAMNETGYKNLMKLSSIGFLEGFYYKPRVDKELLRKYNEGLIATSACIRGEAAVAARVKGYDEAKKAALEYTDIFPGRFYLEIQRHGLPEEDIVNDVFIKVSKETGIPLVCANDAHYAKREHFEAHDALLCIGTASNISDVNRMKYANDQFYYKSPEEMAQLFHDVPEALENTVKIAEQCNFIPETDKYHLPNFPIPKESGTNDPDVYLDILVKQGLEKRFNGEVTPEHIERADYELSVIKKMGFSGYFLITHDFVKWAKEHDIPVGPGRGSAAGSLVAYALEITNINPLEFDLLFERFLNPDRITMPDIDIDFCYERRPEVIDYIKERYGADSVTQIITFGRMNAKAVVRDVARVMGMDYATGDRFAKAIPDGIKLTKKEKEKGMTPLTKAEEISKDLQTYIHESPDTEKLWEISKVLEGMNRQVGIHAAGVVIAPDDLLNYIPLFKSTKGDITTQYDMGCLEQVGMLKVDFLGLRTLTVIKHTLDLLKERGIEIDIDKIPIDDAKVYKLFSEARTFGLFQFESGGMRDHLKKLRPTSINDLVAMNALYRPGPMENIPEYIKRKHGKKVTYLDPKMEQILRPTYGIIVYQEQVMQIASSIAGLSLAKADTLRRAMGKKQKDVMEKMRPEFIEGAKQNGISEKNANDIYDLLIRFAEYGFNKSHSVAYAYIAYQTGYLKAHYPAEFMAANLTSERGEIKRVVELVAEAKKLDIEVMPPDVNTSTPYFSVLEEKISYGLSALKSIGEKAAAEIKRVRDKDQAFTTIFDLASRVDLRTVNRKTFEALIYAGAMDSLEGNRNQKFKAIDMALKYGQRFQDEKLASQVSLFGASTGQVVMNEPELEDIPEWNKQMKLEKEKEFIGFYLTGHPLEPFRDELEAVSNEYLLNEEGAHPPETLRVGGLITNFAINYDKKNNQYARFQFESLTNEFTVLAFKSFDQFKDLLQEDSKIYLEGTLKVDNERDQRPTVFLNFAMPLSDLRENKIRAVNLRILNDKNFEFNLGKLKTVVQHYPGNKVMYIHISYIQTGEQEKIIKVGHGINGAREMVQQLRDIVGQANVWLS
ncbi:MAG: DNA polymerase III subunit alpha [Candidatus Marinimicrobia bacterium]|nr:DNA polymerase III subunit alpha [Candidatus Neomarinimicrobiota bacterium]